MSGFALGMEHQPGLDRRADHWQHRHHAGFCAFAFDRQGRVGPQGDGITDVQAKRLRDAQPAAIQQGEEGDVARLDRRIVRNIAEWSGDISGLIDRQCSGQGRAGPGGGDETHGGDINAMPAAQETKKAAQRGKMLGPG